MSRGLCSTLDEDLCSAKLLSRSGKPLLSLRVCLCAEMFSPVLQAPPASHPPPPPSRGSSAATCRVLSVDTRCSVGTTHMSPRMQGLPLVHAGTCSLQFPQRLETFESLSLPIPRQSGPVLVSGPQWYQPHLSSPPSPPPTPSLPSPSSLTPLPLLPHSPPPPPSLPSPSSLTP